MRPDDVLELLRRRPFRPFRITLTSGQTVDVWHPEMAIVGRSVVAVGIQPAPDDSLVADVVSTLSLLHIVKMEPIHAGKSESGNGHAN